MDLANDLDANELRSLYEYMLSKAVSENSRLQAHKADIAQHHNLMKEIALMCWSMPERTQSWLRNGLQKLNVYYY